MIFIELIFIMIFGVILLDIKEKKEYKVGF